MSVLHRRPGARRVSLAGALVALATACREEPTSPSAPEAPVAQATASAAPLVFKQVSAGAHHTCGVTVDSLAYCWGEGGPQLGIGMGSGLNQTHPVPVAGGLKFLNVNAGTQNTCAIAKDRLAYCWGLNQNGEVGDGTRSPRYTPVRVSGSRQFRQIRAGYRHTCGVTTSDVAFCWGYNSNGAIGDGSLTDRLKPARVAGELRFSQVRAGGSHTCGVTTAGKAYCWGDNFDGQLGDGTQSVRIVPTAVLGGLTFSQVNPGGAHTCGVTGADKAYCWGRNSSGELGDGTFTRRLRPRAVDAGSLLFRGTAPGVFHTCGVTPNGRAFCWGANGSGQLGNGGPQGSSTPVGVDGGLRFDALSTGAVGNHGCGVTTEGAAYCWGENGSGQLGDGTMEDRRAPVPVSAPS